MNLFYVLFAALLNSGNARLGYNPGIQRATLQSETSADVVYGNCITINEQGEALKTLITALRYRSIYRGPRRALLAILLKRRGH